MLRLWPTNWQNTVHNRGALRLSLHSHYFECSIHRQLGIVSIELSIILWFQVITQNYRELRPLPNTATQTLYPRYPTLFDVPSKIIPQFSFCLQVTTDKIWSDTSIYERDQSHFHTQIRGVFIALSAMLTKIALNFGFQKLLTFSLNIVVKQKIYTLFKNNIQGKCKQFFKTKI